MVIYDELVTLIKTFSNKSIIDAVVITVNSIKHSIKGNLIR